MNGARPEPALAPTPPPAAQAALLDRADLLFCLARAFLPPPSTWSVCDWAQPLAEDLADLGQALGIDMVAVQQALDAECARWAEAARRGDGDADGWLVEYTRLFLMPPVVVPLNTGLYLEGSLGGSAAHMMQSCYETAGVQPDEAFHDLPDHVAMQLEFLARLTERAARGDADAEAMAEEFACEFVHGWGAALEQACAVAEARLPAARPYRVLVRLLRVAIADPTLARQ